MREAMRKPAATSAIAKKEKNISHTRLGGREGRLHLPKQDLTQMPTARMKGLGKRRKTSEAPAGKRPKASTE